MTVFRGGRVVDGTGAPARAADVVVEGDTIVAVVDAGDAPADNGDVVDLDGLVLSPGFVDPHTHYDAQVFWDRDLTPSSWHGVSTVVLGNCGFGIAPTHPEHRDTIARTLENVEGMAFSALAAGIPWGFETFPEYLDAIESTPTRLNTAVMIGHSPLRLYVMGDDATERTATPAEVAEMRRLVAEAIDAGAVGFATSKVPVHVGAYGKPVPSRLADDDEIEALCGALGDAGRGTIALAASPLAGHTPEQFAALAEATGRPLTWTALVTGSRAVETLAHQRELSTLVWPQIACRPIVMRLTLDDPGPMAALPAFTEVLQRPKAERGSLIADPEWRDRAREQFSRRYAPEKVFLDETTMHRAEQGRSIAELATDGADPFDRMCDLALAEDLATRFEVVIANDDRDILDELLRADGALLGLSDAGAHASQLCDAVYGTHLLEYWVRERGTLTLEAAIRRLTSHPAEVFGLRGRGRIAPGCAADLVAFDADSVGVGKLERVHDFPTGADRMIAHSRGMDAAWINGVQTRAGGEDLPDVRPGVLVRDAHR